MEGALVVDMVDQPVPNEAEFDAAGEAVEPRADDRAPNGDGVEVRDDDRAAEGNAAGDDATEPRGDEDEPFELTDEPNADILHPIQIVEAVLFSADAPLPAAKIAQAVGAVTAREVRGLIGELNERYESCAAAMRVQEIAGGFQLRTLPEFHPHIAKLHKVRSESKLSPAAMETLSIVAYKQPVTRADVEAVRGVSAGDILNRLREMDLVKIVGRAEDLGRPMLYGTTKRFLEVFGLASLEELPKMEGPGLAPPASNGAASTMKGGGIARPEDMPEAAIPVEAPPGVESE